MKHRISIFQVILILLIMLGLFLIGKGIIENISFSSRTKGFESTIGYFTDYEVYSERYVRRKHRTEVTYRLSYVYYIDGKEYVAKTDYGTGVLPPLGSEKEIKYNPMNVSEAVVTGTNGPKIQIVVGLFFVLIPLVFYLVLFTNCTMNIVDLVVGLVVLLLGLGMIYIIAGGFSIKDLFMTAGPLALIPLMFVGVSVILIKRAILGEKEGKKRGNIR